MYIWVEDDQNITYIMINNIIFFIMTNISIGSIHMMDD